MRSVNFDWWKYAATAAVFESRVCPVDEANKISFHSFSPPKIYGWPANIAARKNRNRFMFHSLKTVGCVINFLCTQPLPQSTHPLNPLLLGGIFCSQSLGIELFTFFRKPIFSVRPLLIIQSFFFFGFVHVPP